MRCPKCNGKTDCINSRDRKLGRVRRRMCNNCGRYSTVEIELKRYESLKKTERIFRANISRLVIAKPAQIKKG
jgi:transcriptional regulator NrdR family protein